MDHYFPGRDFALGDLFLDERRRVTGLLLDETLQRYRNDYSRIFEENRALLRFLAERDTPCPAPLKVAAEFALSAQIEDLVIRSHYGTADLGTIQSELKTLRDEAKLLGAMLDLSEVSQVLHRRILLQVQLLWPKPQKEAAWACLYYLDLIQDLGLSLQLWEAQNFFFALLQKQPSPFVPEERQLYLRLGQRLGFERGMLEQFLH
jgi:hypothetical protein